MAKATKKVESKSADLSKAKSKIENVDEDYVDLSGSVDRKIDVINTGSLILNKVLGCGGIPRGRITEIFGAESSGKTTLAASIAIEAQKAGGSVLYLDFENAFDPNYGRAIGLDLDPNKFALYQPSYFEKAAGLISQSLAKYKVVKSTGEKKEIPEKERGLWFDNNKTVGIGVPNLIVIDSLAAIMTRKEYEGEADDPAEVGLLARVLSRYLRKLVTKIRETNCAIVLINQERTNISIGGPPSYGPNYTTPGGKAIKFYASLRMRLQITKKEKAKVTDPATNQIEELPIQNVIKCTTIKNKVGNPYRSGNFIIRYGEGVDNLRSVIDIAINNGLIKKTGGWFNYESMEDEKKSFKVQGLEKVREHLVNNPDTIVEIQDRLEDVMVVENNTVKASDYADSDDIEFVSEEYDVE